MVGFSWLAHVRTLTQVSGLLQGQTTICTYTSGQFRVRRVHVFGLFFPEHLQTSHAHTHTSDVRLDKESPFRRLSRARFDVTVLGKKNVAVNWIKVLMDVFQREHLHPSTSQV